MSSRPATVKDVARQAGVSVATVSRVLAGTAAVSGPLAGRVKAAASALRYQPDRVARSLRVRRSRSIGVIIPDIQNPFFTGVIRGIEDRLRATDYTLLLSNSDNDPVREQACLDVLRAEGVAGVLFVPSSADVRPYRTLLASGLAMVAIDRLVPSLPCDGVAVANADGAAHATRHLLEVGHRRIAIITGPADVETAVERLDGYRRALREAGITLDPSLVQQVPFTIDGGYHATRRLLALPKPPSAIFAGSDLTALGVLRALHEEKVRIPQKMAIVSFDDIPWAMVLQPALTTVAQPTYELGASAARLLLERLSDPRRAPQQVRLQTQLMVRASCGAGN